MSEAERTDEQPGEGGVFGNLPRTRPAVRSPRRRERRRTAPSRPSPAGDPDRPRARPSPRPPKPAGARAGPTPPPAGTGGPPPRVTQSPPASSEHGEEPPGGADIGSLEDLAWAGITVAAEAATLGVRLASRAIEAVRDSVERR